MISILRISGLYSGMLGWQRKWQQQRLAGNLGRPPLLGARSTLIVTELFARPVFAAAIQANRVNQNQEIEQNPPLAVIARHIDL